MKSPEIAQKFLEIANNLSKEAFPEKHCMVLPVFLACFAVNIPIYWQYLEGFEPILNINPQRVSNPSYGRALAGAPLVRMSRSLAYIGTRLRELEIIPYMVQTYA